MHVEALQTLVNTLKKKDPYFEDDLENVMELLPACADYVRAVSETEQLRMFRNHMEPEDYREQMQAADAHRTNCHNKMIGCISLVNRLCSQFELPPFYTGGSHRVEYADAAILLLDEMFNSRTR